MPRLLLVGESWSVTSIHAKGFDTFTTVEYAEGGAALIEALEAGGHDVAYMPSHVAANNFPASADELSAFDVILFSDIGSNTLLLSSATFARGQVTSNRLDVLCEWVRAGGGFGMIGGYLSFQGIDAKANYRNTSVAEILPVEMLAGDDRVEAPQGVRPTVVGSHAIVEGIRDAPPLLGYQRLIARPGTQTVLAVGPDPLLTLGTAGAGRVAAYASDIGHHWAPEAFTNWEGFATIWSRTASWLAGERAEETGSP